jgi:phage tail protein X
MSKVYKTIQGDTWDIIAYKVYQRESCMTYLLAANPAYIETAIFGAGVEITCPDIPAEASNILPPWRR